MTRSCEKSVQVSLLARTCLKSYQKSSLNNSDDLIIGRGGKKLTSLHTIANHIAAGIGQATLLLQP